ncbi:MAG: hypothetical protein Q9165_007748 [Trypethelium subeluteriae]
MKSSEKQDVINPGLKPSEVYACQTDVPLNNTLAVQQIQWIKNFWQFQSTLAYLKDPPPAYAPPATDIMGGLDLISSHAASGRYQNMYDFELDIHRLVASAMDGHFNYPTWLLNQFIVNRTVTLVSISFDGIQEPKVGQELAQMHLLKSPPHSPSSEDALTTSSSSTSTPFVGYPVPVPGTSHPEGYVSGYFLKDTASSDVAVLSITSFGTETDNEALVFQDAVRKFLAACRSNQKKRLIIDVRQNGGGEVSHGFDTFRQLFPTLIPSSGFRIRAFEAVSFIGEQISQVLTNADEQDFQDSTFLAQLHGGWDWSAYDYRSSLRIPDGPPYSSWAEFYGPLQVHNDSYSHVGYWQLSDSGSNAQYDAGGYGNRSNLLPQVFLGSNIILVSERNVTKVTAGGRPNREPTAAIGGVQGFHRISFSDIKKQVLWAHSAVQQENDTNLAAKWQELLGPIASNPPIWPTSLDECHVNMRDSIARDDASMTPLQFTRSSKADCRFFYMPKDMSSVEYTWSRVANGIAGGGNSFCIDKTLGHDS